MNCKNCGKELTDETKFCGYCGTPVEQETVMTDENTVKAAEQNSEKEMILRSDENPSAETHQIKQYQSVSKSVNTPMVKTQNSVSAKNAIKIGINKLLIIAGIAFAALAIVNVISGIISLAQGAKAYTFNYFEQIIMELIAYVLISVACFKFSPRVFLAALMVLGFADRLFDSILRISDSWKSYVDSFGLGKTILYLTPAVLLIIVLICGVLCLCLYCFSQLNRFSFSKSGATDKEPFVNVTSISATSYAKDNSFAPLNRLFSILPGGQIKKRINLKKLSTKKKAVFVICSFIVIIGLIFFIKGISGTGKPEYNYYKSADSEYNDVGNYSQVMSDEQAVSALYATSAFKGDSSYEIAVQYGSIKDVSIGNALDYMFQNPNVTCEAGNDCVYVTVSGMYSINGSQHSSASITYKVDSGYNVSVYRDSYGIKGKVTQWAAYLASQ